MKDGYRIFLSIDVVSSTKIKREEKDFARIIAETLYAGNRPLDKHIKAITDNFLKVWKYIGDEIVFMSDSIKEIDCNRLLKVINVVCGTVNDINDTAQSSKNNFEVKGCFWIVSEFDRSSSEDLDLQSLIQDMVAISCDTEKGKDFIGVGMDYGFRLGTKASVNNLLISKKLVNIILNSVDESKKEIAEECCMIKDSDLIFKYCGRAELKGISTFEPIITVSRLSDVNKEKIKQHKSKMSLALPSSKRLSFNNLISETNACNIVHIPVAGI